MSAIVCRCVNKIRNSSNQITDYVLVDDYGNTTSIEASKLKSGIKAHHIKVVNLQLDTLGRLVDKKEEVKTAEPVGTDRVNRVPAQTNTAQANTAQNNIEQANIAKLKSSIRPIIANCKADDIQEYTHGYSFTRWCQGGNDYDDETCSIKCKEDKFIVSSHNASGSDNRFVFTDLSEALEKLKNSPGF